MQLPGPLLDQFCQALLAEAARRIQRYPPIFTEEERRRFLIEE